MDHPNAGHWFELAEKAIAVLELVAKATDRLAAATEKMYEIERNKLL
jgi:hypothetical protein